jgi:energy-coupling factor transporter ATP-binding protein EcfA2
MVDLTLPAQGGWTVIAGRNSSGKSTLLQALALALGGPAVARTLVADFEGWVSARAGSGWAEARVVRDSSWDVFVGSGRVPTNELVLGLEWVRPAQQQNERSQSLRPTMKTFDYRGTEPASHQGERGPWAENPRGWLSVGYGPFRRLVGGSGDAQRLMLAPGPGRMATLFHEDASLGEGVPWLIDLHLRRLENRPGAGPLLDAVLKLLADGLLPEDHQISGVDSDGLWVKRNDEQAYPLREMSDGYRTVAALVLDIVRQIHAAYGALDTEPADDGGIAVTAPGVVLIDEVDAHLHITWQRRIGDWLREHFPNIQFIVTSHSPYICQAADPGGLIRLPGPGEQAPPLVVEEELYQRIVYGSADDAALSELFGLETPYSDQAERKRQRLVELERKVYAGTATNTETMGYQQLSELLTSSLETRVTEVAARLGGDQ